MGLRGRRVLLSVHLQRCRRKSGQRFDIVYGAFRELRAWGERARRSGRLPGIELSMSCFNVLFSYMKHNMKCETYEMIYTLMSPRCPPLGNAGKVSISESVSQ
jgi:hypothetical protein